ncbi:hypothetical protein EIP91_002316 [Steccherinum ochraceum]|uniref:F-box domain-containing protein n=1 Tax=Steccherinum ochraceum TaxID=92696 RepID=A0A4R0RKU2_9APHY|nr:hypothetical protein EIP91_002316 [Steccherinum ochraceum]
MAFVHRVCGPDPFFPCDDPLLVGTLGYADLLVAAIVCRSWHAAALPALYAHPLITSNTRLLQFCRTLQTNPDFGLWVTHLHLLNQQTELQVLTAKKSRFPFRRRRVVVGPELVALDQVRATVLDVLPRCKNLVALVVTNRDRLRSSIVPLDSVFVHSSSIGSRLRHLTIYGSPLIKEDGPGDLIGHEVPLVLGPDISLPVLEILCLRSVGLQSSTTFPVFPRLRELQFADCTCLGPFTPEIPGFSRNTPPEINATNFPRLRTLLLYDNWDSITLSEDLAGVVREIEFINTRVTPARPLLCPSGPASLKSLRCIKSTSLDAVLTLIGKAPDFPPALRVLLFILTTNFSTSHIDQCSRFVDHLTRRVASFRDAPHPLARLVILRNLVGAMVPREMPVYCALNDGPQSVTREYHMFTTAIPPRNGTLSRPSTGEDDSSDEEGIFNHVATTPELETAWEALRETQVLPYNRFVDNRLIP